jgi:hypothetical protein
MQNDIIFVVTLFIMMLATLPVVHFRSRINSFISQDPELTSKFATALSKRSIALIVLGWNTFLIFLRLKCQILLNSKS